MGPFLEPGTSGCLVSTGSGGVDRAGCKTGRFTACPTRG